MCEAGEVEESNLDRSAAVDWLIWLGELAPPDRLHVAGGACPDPVRTCKTAFNSLFFFLAAAECNFTGVLLI